MAGVQAVDGGVNPLYREVMKDITRSLAEGEWKPGEAIPSESRLAQRFEVSIGTIRKAIDDLVAAKILTRRQGLGTFVAMHDHNRFLQLYFRVVRQDGVKEAPQTRFVSFAADRATVAEAQKLDVIPGEPVFRMSNLLWLAGVPVDWDRIVVPRALVPDLDEETFRSRENTVYGLYQERYGISVLRTVETLHAVVADAETTRILQLPADVPHAVLQIDRVAYTYNDRPVELRTSLVNTANHRYLNTLGNSD